MQKPLGCILNRTTYQPLCKMVAKGIEEEAIQRAEDVRRRAHAPYSQFRVGAVLVCKSGEMFVGCNVENISFGLTMCAERVALGSAISNGIDGFDLLVLTADSAEPIVPCGACRQVLAEFNPTLRVVSVTSSGKRAEFRLAELLPLPRQGILA